MPIFEVPTQPSSSPPEPPRLNRRSRYEDLEPHEVFHLIEQLEDERARARFRESVWISLIINMIVMWFLFYGPRYIFHQVHVVNPADVIRQRQDELRYLDLPPDALKHIKPKQPAPMSDKDRVAQSRKPTLDKKTLQQLEAMKRAGPPVPQPAPEPQQQQPSPAPQQQAPQQQQAQAAPPKPSQPIPQNQQSQLEAPPPAPTAPNFQQGPSSPGQAIRDAARAAAHGGPQFGGDSGANAPSQHSGMNGGVDILSDTMGVDFGPYMKRIIYDTERAWWPIIPQVAQPPLSKQGRTGIRFKIYPDGSVKEMILELPSGDVSLDRAAWGGITGASPYPALPKQFKGPYLELRFWFLYNLSPEQIR